MISIRVEDQVRKPPSEVKNLLEAYRDYDEWWPFSVTVRGLDPPVIEVSVVPFVSLGLQPTDTKKRHQVTYRYVRGPFRGSGSWKIQPLGDASQASRLAYTINLRPVNGLVRLVSGTSFFRSRHRSDIHQIIDSMEEV